MANNHWAFTLTRYSDDTVISLENTTDTPLNNPGPSRLSLVRKAALIGVLLVIEFYPSLSAEEKLAKVFERLSAHSIRIEEPGLESDLLAILRMPASLAFSTACHLL